MWSGLRDLDQILRGDATRLSTLRQGTVPLSLGGLSVVIVALGMLYGACMGSYALFKGGGPSFIQLFAAMVKVPLLFFLTLVVTFPLLYVFNAIVGSRLTVLSVLQLLIASLGVMLAVLASFGPIVAFFSVSSTSYPFMQLLNVAVFAVSVSWAEIPAADPPPHQHCPGRDDGPCSVASARYYRSP